MKERLNLTIDGALLEAMKAYAASKGTSVSELVESYFRRVTKPVQRRNILDLVDELDARGSRSPESGTLESGLPVDGSRESGLPVDRSREEVRNGL